jgi:DNA polymerase III alpha subunit
MNLGTVEIFAEAQEEILGKDHAYPMIAFGTLKKKSAFKLYARANDLNFDIANEISKQIEKYDEAVKYAEDDEKDEIDIYDYVDEQYRDYIEKSEKYWGVISDKKKAPCAYLLYQGSIREEIGLIKCKSESTKKEYMTAVIDGAIAEKYKFLKNDLLKVDVVMLIDMIYKRIGIPVHSASDIISLVENDKKVWDIYANGYTIGVNQCEKESAMKKLRKYKPQNISELCAWIAAIRPAFKSMYSKFESRESFEYGIPAFDKILQTPQFPYSYVLYQEQTMNTLNYAGFPLDECYGIIKAIAKKHPEKVKPLKARFIEGFKNKIMQDDHIEAAKAEETSARVWQIIDDSCGYGFNSAHAYCMAIDSLYCAYLKAHHTYEFYEVLLQVFSDKGKKDKVQALKQEMLTAFGIKEGEYKFGVDNRRFVADKENGVINPSLLSIKGLSQGCANELYDLSQKKHFDNFYDLWKEINALPSLNSAKIDTLIKMNYFKDYGSIDKIQKFIRAIDILHGKSQFSKDKIPCGFEEIIKHHTVETDKQYRKFDYEAALRETWEKIPNTVPSIYKIVNYQYELFGYISYVDPSAQNAAVIMDIDTRYSTFRAQLYCLSNGHTVTVKLKKKSYEQMPIAVGQVIKYFIDKKPGWKRLDDGTWQQDYSKEDLWLSNYTIV